MAALHLATRVFLVGNHISDEQRARKSTRKEATKFEKVKRRNPRKNPRKEKKRNQRNKNETNVKLREIERYRQNTYLQRFAFR